MADSFANTLARSALIKAIVKEVLTKQPTLANEPWDLADACTSLWTERHPELQPIDEDDVFAAAGQLGYKQFSAGGAS